MPGLEAEVMPRCPSCGAPYLAGDQFCEDCGHELGVRAGASSCRLARPVGESAAAGCASCGAADFDEDGYCLGCGLRRGVVDRTELAAGPIVGVTDRGKHHERNEDAMALRWDDDRRVAIIVVCDGVSTSDDGDEAARHAADTAADALAESVRAGTDPADGTASAALLAADVVAAIGEGYAADHAPACTYVSAVVTDDAVTVGWVGDSRAYWLSADPHGTPSECLTTDDSWATQMIEAGLLDHDAALADPRAHALTAWLGADGTGFTPSVRTFRSRGRGVVLICTDGLWNCIERADAIAVRAVPAAMDDPSAAARTLTDLALDAGGHDNITVALVRVPPRPRSES